MRQYYRGKRISKGEKRIAQYFDKFGIKYIREKSFEDCVNAKGNCLRFDFYLEQFNILLEYQGQHHEKPVNKHRRAKIVHEKTVVHDKIKVEFAASHSINLITINYPDYDKIEYILDKMFDDIRQYWEIENQKKEIEHGK